MARANASLRAVDGVLGIDCIADFTVEDYTIRKASRHAIPYARTIRGKLPTALASTAEVVVAFRDATTRANFGLGTEMGRSW